MRETSGNSEITVVGAGPAGLASAIVLARAGRRVHVREWHSDVGDRFHDDFQGLENWSRETDVLAEMRAVGIGNNFEYTGIVHGTVFDPLGRKHAVRGTRPLLYLLRRGAAEGSLDRALLEQARAAGARVSFNDRVRSFDGPGILASGPRQAGIIATGKLFDTDMADGAWLAFGRRLAPGGYAYLLVKDGRGTVASCMFTEFRNQALHVKATVEFFERHTGLRMQNMRGFGGYGNIRLPKNAVQGGHPVVGEHAGFQDALAGFGMRHAIRSGVLAAQSILEGRDYARLWHKELGPYLRAGISNRLIYTLAGERGLAFALNQLAKGDAGKLLRRAYGPSLAKRMLLPIARYRYRRSLADPSCAHIDCNCVWCQHGEAHDGNGMLAAQPCNMK